MSNVPGGFDSHTLPPSPPAAHGTAGAPGRGGDPRRDRVGVGLVAALLLLVPPPAGAQEAAGDTARSPVLAQEQEAAPDTTPPVTPLGAFGRSLLLPGWGQVAVDRPGRGAFYFGVEAASVWMVIKTQAKLDAAQAGNDTALVSARKQQREDWIALSVFWALLSGVDAWVSTHFWDYEGAVTPPEEGTAGAAVRVEVPLGGG